mmetsp:Transcript_31671/g.67293  ORF Transcript_31671/g.67293 Transcript_31671/m.67293 type:complete len:272 (-) Transcript_31671:922-1737(-)
MAMTTASRLLVASLMAASFSAFSSSRISVLLFRVVLSSPRSLSRAATSRVSFPRRASLTSNWPLSSAISSALVSRVCSASATWPSHQPLWLASSCASFNSLSTKSWISSFTFAKGSLAARVAKARRGALPSSRPLSPSSAAQRARRPRRRPEAWPEASGAGAADSSFKATAAVAAGKAERSPRWRRSKWREEERRARVNCTRAGGSAATATGSVATLGAPCASRTASPELKDRASMASIAFVSALSSFARIWLRSSQSCAFSPHLALKSRR